MPYPARLFKYIQSARSTHTPDASLVPPQRNRAARLRFGRGGRIHLDRRLYNSRQLPSDSDSDSETTEVHRRLQERWRFDDDDVPAVGPEGTEEQDRKLADDFDAKYVLRLTLNGHMFNNNCLGTSPIACHCCQTRSTTC